MVQGRTNIGQLVSQLSLSEKYGSGRTMGTSWVLFYILIVFCRHSEALSIQCFIKCQCRAKIYLIVCYPDVSIS